MKSRFAGVLVWVAALTANAQVARLVDLQTQEAVRSSLPGSFVRLGDDIGFLANDRFGTQMWLTSGTAQTTRRVTSGQSVVGFEVLVESPAATVFQLYDYSSAPQLFEFRADAGTQSLTPPAGPLGAGQSYFKPGGSVGTRGFFSQCQLDPVLSVLVCQLLELSGSSLTARPLPTASYNWNAVTLRNSLLIRNAPASLPTATGWLSFDGQTIARIPQIPSAVAWPLSDTRVLFDSQAGQLYVYDSTAGVSLVSTQLAAGQSVRAATGNQAVVMTYSPPRNPVSLLNLTSGTQRSIGTTFSIFGSTAVNAGRLLMGLASTGEEDEPWIVELDGGLTQLANANGSMSSEPRFIARQSGPLTYFWARAGGGTQQALWRTDGTPAGTFDLGLSSAVFPGAQAEATERFLAGPVSMSLARDTSNFYPAELVLSDGTVAGSAVVDLNPGTSPSEPRQLVALTGEVALLSTAPDASVSLLTVDVLDAGVHVWLQGGPASAGASIAVGERLVFAWDEGTVGRELWLLPSADGGAERVDLEPGRRSSAPEDFVRSGTTVFFTAHHADFGRELWSTDGRAEGTHLVRDVREGPVSSAPTALAALQGGLVFLADDGVSGLEPWFTDGSAGGTRLIKDLVAGPGSSAPSSVVSSGELAWFAADDGVTGAELWRTDGTAAGTLRVADLMPGAAGSNPTPRAARGQQLLFTALTPSGRVVAFTDGTATGTVELLPLGARRFELAQATLHQWFFVLDDLGVRSLWVTTGTAASTRELRHWPSATPPWLAPLGDGVAFAAGSDAGEELWTSDGLDAGPVADIALGRLDSWPGAPAQVGTRLVFAATDTDDDREPWVWLLPSALDNTPPRVEVEVTGPRQGEWYVGDTVVTFHAEDPDSPLLEFSGCDGGAVLEEGTLQFDCRVRSSGGQGEASLVLKRDVTAPVLTCPEDRTVDQTLDGGAALSLDVSATDTVDPAPTLVITPSLGVFPVGTTEVRASATDSAGHQSTCRFHVIVRPPALEAPVLPTTKLRPTGCGCTEAGGADALAAVLALGALVRRRRRSPGGKRTQARSLLPMLALVLCLPGLAAAAPKGKVKSKAPRPPPSAPARPEFAAPTTPATPAAANSVELSGTAEVARIQGLFEALDYESVVTATVQLLGRPELPLDARVEAYRLQGCARAVVEDPVDAEQPFRLLLRARPTYELPDTTSPKILAVFRKVQSEERALNATMRQVERKRLIANLSLIGEAPTQAVGGQPLRFSWRLRDPQGVVDGVEVPYRKAGQHGFSTLNLERSDTGVWKGLIPADFTANDQGLTLEYFVRTVDREGPLLMLGSEGEPKSVRLSAGATQVARYKPLSRAAFWTSTVVTVLFALAAGGFALAVPFEERAYQQGALAGRPGAELVAVRNRGTTFALLANVGWIATGAAGATSLVMIPFTDFGE